MESRRVRKAWIFIILSIWLASCSKEYVPPAPGPPVAPGLKSQKPYQINGVWYYPLPSAEGYVEDGLASWYGADFHGKRTSCGEPYNMWSDTAAHKTLPLGTNVKVTNLENGRSTILRINDRGPFVAGRIIDLSAKASQDLGCHVKGLAKVRVEAVQCATPSRLATPRIGRWTPCRPSATASSPSRSGLLETGPMLPGSGIKWPVKTGKLGLPTSRKCPWYRVQVGSYQDIVVAKAEMDRFRSGGFPGCFCYSR